MIYFNNYFNNYFNILVNTKQTKEITCTLPPVLCETQSIRNNKIKSTSAPAQCPQPSTTSDEFRDEPRKTKTRQASVQLSKQYKAKQMQNVLFSHPGMFMNFFSVHICILLKALNNMHRIISRFETFSRDIMCEVLNYLWRSYNDSVYNLKLCFIVKN